MICLMNQWNRMVILPEMVQLLLTENQWMPQCMSSSNAELESILKCFFFFCWGGGGSDGRRIEYGYWFMVY